MDYCSDSTAEFDILNLHSYDSYDLFFFVFSVALLNGVCFGCGCIGYRLIFTAGSNTAAMLRHLTSPHLMEMETPAHLRSDGVEQPIDEDLDFEVVDTPSLVTTSVQILLPPIDLHRHCGVDASPDARYSVTATSESRGRVITRRVTDRSNSRAPSVPLTTRRSCTVATITGIDGSPNSSESSRTHFTWINPKGDAAASPRSVSESMERGLAMADERALAMPDRTISLRQSTGRRSKSNLSKLEPIDESFERYAESDSIDLL